MDMPLIPVVLPELSALLPKDRLALVEAVRLLERVSLPMRLAGVVGGAANRGLAALLLRTPTPMRWLILKMAQPSANRALTIAYRTVLPTLGRDRPGPDGSAKLRRRLTERAQTMASGALGGAGGLASTAVELPITTGLLLRAIARIAREEGEDLRADAACAECLKVLALGAPDGESYFATRLALAEAVAAVSGKAIGDVLPRIAAAVLPRFGLSVTWKFAGQMVPMIGAASGAMLNLAFTTHYQDKARGHFIVRRLERAYGPAVVREYYERLRGTLPAF